MLPSNPTDNREMGTARSGPTTKVPRSPAEPASAGGGGAGQGDDPLENPAYWLSDIGGLGRERPNRLLYRCAMRPSLGAVRTGLTAEASTTAFGSRIRPSSFSIVT